jgi:protein phosphatase
MKITVGQITDRGLSPKREVNEDNLLALPKRGLFLVADGVGGRRGGQVASQTVVDVFSRVFNQDHTDDLRDLIAGTIDLCNQKIYEDAESNPELQGMATTIALVAVAGNRAIVAHVGDSRVYRFDDQGLIALTEDHSEVGEALRAGAITEEQAITHPRRNVINRALGAEANVDPDIIEIEIDDRTSFLLCSDGITRHITDDEIARLLRSSRRPEGICETMKELCYAGGAEDNLTAIVVDFGDREYIEEPTKPAPKIARAKAAPVTGIPAPRPTKRLVEVDLTGPQSVGTRTENTPPSNFRPGAQVDLEEIKTAPAQNASTPGSGAAPGVGATVNAAVRSGKSPARSAGRRLPQKGELSKVMKWSFLLGSLIAGVIIGSLFGKPIADQYERLFGNRGIYESQGIDRPPGDAEVRAAYARFIEGQTTEARQRLNQVLTANPNHAEANFYLGRIDYAEGKFDDAINHFSQALKLDPKLPDVEIHLAMAYLSIGQSRNARDILQQAVNPSAPTQTGSPSPTPSMSPEGAKPVG